MKKFILLLFLFIPFIGFTQVKIVLNDGTVLFTELEGFFGENLTFKKKLPETDIDQVNIFEVDSIFGKMPGFRVKAIQKANPEVFIRNIDQYFTPFVEVPQNRQFSKYEITAGDYIQRAGNRYVTGLALGVGGAVILISANSESDALALIGGLTSLTGVIISITGHFQLIKAGKKMKSDAVTLAPSSQGIGLAINF